MVEWVAVGGAPRIISSSVVGHTILVGRWVIPARAPVVIASGWQVRDNSDVVTAVRHRIQRRLITCSGENNRRVRAVHRWRSSVGKNDHAGRAKSNLSAELCPPRVQPSSWLAAVRDIAKAGMLCPSLECFMESGAALSRDVHGDASHRESRRGRVLPPLALLRRMSGIGYIAVSISKRCTHGEIIQPSVFVSQAPCLEVDTGLQPGGRGQFRYHLLAERASSGLLGSVPEPPAARVVDDRAQASDLAHQCVVSHWI